MLRPSAFSPPAARPRLLVESLVVFALFVFALAVRWPFLFAAPELTDETREMEHALRAYGGELLLTGWSPYLGVLHSYLLVVGWRLFGLDPDLPRILALVAGAATVPAAYWLGRELRDRTVGLVAAVLVGATAYHILIASHVGWSHCLTPLFATLALAALARALRRGEGTALALSGLLFGLALQTHPLAALLVPGPLALALIRRRSLVLSRAGIAAAVLFLLATSSYVVNNLATGFHAVDLAAERRQDYGASAFTAAGYVSQLAAELPSLGATLAGWVPDGGTGLAAALLGGEFLSLYVLALGQQARRGNALLLAASAPALLALPLLTGKFGLPSVARSYMPMLVLMQVAMAGAVVDLSGLLAGKRPRLRPLLNGCLAVALVAPGLLALGTYYARVQAAGSRTAEMVAAADVVQAQWQPGLPVVVDLGADAQLGQGGDVSDALRGMLRASGVAFTRSNVDVPWIDRARARGWRGLALLDCKDYRYALKQPGVADLSPRRAARGCLVVGLVRFGPAAQARVPLQDPGYARLEGASA